MIRGIGQRESIIYSPSREILHTVSKYAVLSEEDREKASCPECGPHEPIEDVVTALLTKDPAITKEIMDKYNADYVLVTERDRATSFVFLTVAGYEPSEFLDNENKPKEQGMMLFRMIDGEGIEGFERVYSDSSVRIYKKI